jgi:uncharacterized membrane protein YuzA (DUF378 family)
MAEIPWWAWLGVGLFVAITSAVMGGKISIFAWVGLIFIVVGIAKVVYLFVLHPKESKADQQAMHMRQPQLAPQAPSVLYCPRCRITVQPTDHFCRYCGWRLR